MTYIIVRGQRFEVLGPVDRRRSVEFTPHGRALCPSCLDGGRQVGVFSYTVTADPGPAFNSAEKTTIRRLEVRVNRYFVEHLKTDHYRCTKCGWVGVKPGQHIVRSEHHQGPVSTTRKRPPKPIRISRLFRR